MLDPIGVVFQLKDRASGSIGKLQQRFEQLHGTSDRVTKAFNAHAKRMVQGMSLMVGGAVGANMLRGLANDATTFEAALTMMGKTARATAHDLRRLEKKALKLGVEFEFSPAETVMGMKSLASAGLNTQQVLDTITPTLRLAGAATGDISIPQAAETLIAAMKGYGKSVDQSGALADMVTRATQISNLRFKDFQQALGSVSGKAGILNQDLKTTLSLLGVVRNLGSESAPAAQRFKMALQSLMQPQAERRAAELGIALRGPTGEMRQLDRIIKDCIPKLDRLGARGKALAVGDLFGFRSMEVYRAIEQAAYTNPSGKEFLGPDAFAAMRDELTNSKGAAEEFQRAFLNTAEGSKKLVEGAWQTLRIQLGKPLLEPIKRLNKGLLGCLERVLELCNQSPKFGKLVSGVLAWGSGFALAVGGAIAAKGALAMLALAVGPLLPFLGGMAVLLLKGTLLVGGLVLAFKGLKDAYDTNLGGFGDAVGGFAKDTSLLAQTAWGFFSKGYISEDLGKQLDEAGLTGTVERLIRLFDRCKAAWGGFKKGFIEGWDAFKPLLNVILVPLSMALLSVQCALGALVGDADKAGGGLEKHTDSLLHVADTGRSLGRIVAGVATCIAVSLGWVAVKASLLVVAIAAGVRLLSHLFERVVHGWNVFRDSSLGTWLLGARRKAPRQHLLINGIQDFHAAFPQQRAIAAQTMSLLPASSDPLLAGMADRQTETKVLPVNPMRDLIGPAGLNHMTALTRSFTGGGADQRESERAQRTEIASDMLGQALREFTAARTAPPAVPPIQLMVDGRKMAEVINAHNLRTARHHGEQG